MDSESIVSVRLPYFYVRPPTSIRGCVCWSVNWSVSWLVGPSITQMFRILLNPSSFITQAAPIDSHSHSFIHLFIHSFIHSFIHLYIYSFIYSFIFQKHSTINNVHSNIPIKAALANRKKVVKVEFFPCWLEKKKTTFLWRCVREEEI